jgi:uncharacterized alkaline shock family protein YloU
MKDEARKESVEVSREAVATLAAQAVGEVQRVEMCHQKTVESITSRVKRAHVHKGIRVSREDGSFRVSVYLKVDYGANIPSLAEEVREKVKEYVQGITELELEDVEVVVEDIKLPSP